MAQDRDVRTLIMAAARAEIAAHGIAGARMRRIATAAGVSSERIYAYFGDKNGLYLEVLAETGRELSSVLFDPLDVLGWVRKLFDHRSEHQDLMRIMRWSYLEGIYPEKFHKDDPRLEPFRDNIKALKTAQDLGLVDSSFTPTELYSLLGALAGAWFHAPVELRMLDEDERSGSNIDEQRIEAVIEAATRLIQPKTASTSVNGSTDAKGKSPR